MWFITRFYLCPLISIICMLYVISVLQCCLIDFISVKWRSTIKMTCEGIWGFPTVCSCGDWCPMDWPITICMMVLWYNFKQMLSLTGHNGAWVRSQWWSSGVHILWDFLLNIRVILILFFFNKTYHILLCRLNFWAPLNVTFSIYVVSI